MNFSSWLGVVSGIVTIFSFMFALWIWMRTDMRIRELIGALESIYDISGSILWETLNLNPEDAEARIHQAERAVGLASSIHTISSKYITIEPGFRATEIGALIERGIIWTNAMMWNLENSPAVKEVWLVTPDLRPDISDAVTGALVGNNIRKGKRYVYFFPSAISNSGDLIEHLKANLHIGATKSRSTVERLVTVEVNAMEFPIEPGTGNVVFYFKNNSRLSRGDAFKEIVFTQVSERGIFWQPCRDAEADDMYQILRGQLARIAR